MSESVFTMLTPGKVSDVAYVGHILERQGLIEHDEQLASGYNDMARRALREAEAFEAGYRAGLMRLMEDEGELSVQSVS